MESFFYSQDPGNKKTPSGRESTYKLCRGAEIGIIKGRYFDFRTEKNPKCQQKPAAVFQSLSLSTIKHGHVPADLVTSIKSTC